MYIKEFVKESLGQITEGMDEGKPGWKGFDDKFTGMEQSHRLAKDGSPLRVIAAPFRHRSREGPGHKRLSAL